MSVLVRQLQYLGLVSMTAAGLAAVIIAGAGAWLILIGIGVVSNGTDAWTTPIGVIFLLAAALLALIAWVGATFCWRPFAASPIKAAASLGVAYAGGSAIAVASWSACYGNQDGLSAPRIVPAVALAALAAVALVVARPLDLVPGIAVGAGAVAVVVFWWLVGNTAAVGCPWYQTPTPTPVPSPTTSIDVGPRSTTVPPSVPSTTLGP